MKFITLLTLPFLSFATLINGSNKPAAEKSVTAIHELTDVKSVKFASNLTDWRGDHVDSLVMDLYYPTGATSDKKYPVLLFCHAGGFTGGNRTNVSAICDRFADSGFIAIGFDYRVGYRKGDTRNCETDTLTQNNAIYRAVQDAKAALRFIMAHASDYNIDTSKIFIGGSSAGAVLALTASYVDDSIAQLYWPESYQLLGSVETSGNTLTNKYNLKGIISMWGALKDDKMIDTNYRAYPTILFRGDEDEGIPDSFGHYATCVNFPTVFGATGIYDRLRSLNVPAVYHLLSLGNHSAYDDQFCVEQSVCFLRAVMAGRAYSGEFHSYTPSCQ
jgi:acetyl esterase/lipase